MKHRYSNMKSSICSLLKCVSFGDLPTLISPASSVNGPDLNDYTIALPINCRESSIALSIVWFLEVHTSYTI